MSIRDEAVGGVRLLEDLLQVRFAQAWVKLQAELGQLDREVALHPRCPHVVDHHAVRRRRLRRGRLRPDMFAEIVERVSHPAPLNGARRSDGFGDVGAADESARGGVGAAHAVARRCFLQQAAVGGREEEPAGECFNKHG